jgi:hypothetical protein
MLNRGYSASYLPPTLVPRKMIATALFRSLYNYAHLPLAGQFRPMVNLLTLYDLEKFKLQPFEDEGAPRGCVRRLGGGEQTLCMQKLEPLFQGSQHGISCTTP